MKFPLRCGVWLQGLVVVFTLSATHVSPLQAQMAIAALSSQSPASMRNVKLGEVVSGEMPDETVADPELPEAPSSSRTLASFPELAKEAVPDRVPPSPPNAHELSVDNEIQRNTACDTGEWRGKACRVSWIRIFGSSMFFISAQHGGNVGMDDDARYHLLHHTNGFWGDYVDTLHRYRYNRWKDDAPFGVVYVGHPIMGAITNSIYEQNDPKQRALLFENSRRYWMGRLRATAYSEFYAVQWKLGPLSESSIGNIGIKTYYSPSLGRYTNETGMVSLVVTSTGGLLWNMGEDYIDRKIFSRVARNVRNRPVLVAASFMLPCKSGANILRFRAPYYRDRDAESSVPLRP